jgi:glycerol kinase
MSLGNAFTLGNTATTIAVNTTSQTVALQGQPITVLVTNAGNTVGAFIRLVTSSTTAVQPGGTTTNSSDASGVYLPPATTFLLTPPWSSGNSGFIAAICNTGAANTTLVYAMPGFGTLH